MPLLPTELGSVMRWSGRIADLPDWERLRDKLRSEGLSEWAGILRHALDWKAWEDRGKTGLPPSWGPPLPFME
jgi:hypothetical protein